eukprot:m.29477 g.29477  ORF g.29477 m.29477 type:complete len:65 (+) comp9170_c1_seq1:4674-4868(+)
MLRRAPTVLEFTSDDVNHFKKHKLLNLQKDALASLAQPVLSPSAMRAEVQRRIGLPKGPAHSTP